MNIKFSCNQMEMALYFTIVIPRLPQTQTPPPPSVVFLISPDETIHQSSYWIYLFRLCPLYYQCEYRTILVHFCRWNQFSTKRRRKKFIMESLILIKLCHYTTETLFSSFYFPLVYLGRFILTNLQSILENKANFR